MRNLSIIFPVYNEELRIKENLEKTIEYLIYNGINAQLIIVNNGSVDKTEEIVNDIIKTHQDVDILLLNLKEKGLGLAIKQGIAHAKNNNIMFYAIDLPFGTDIIKQSLDSLSETDAAIIIGSKGHKNSVIEVPLKRKISSFIYNRLLRLFFKIKIKDTQGSLIFRKDKISSLLIYCTASDAFFCGQLIIYASFFGLPIMEIPVKYVNPRKDSKISWLRDGLSMLYEVVREKIIFYKNSGQGKSLGLIMLSIFLLVPFWLLSFFTADDLTNRNIFKVSSIFFIILLLTILIYVFNKRKQNNVEKLSLPPVENKNKKGGSALSEKSFFLLLMSIGIYLLIYIFYYFTFFKLSFFYTNAMRECGFSFFGSIERMHFGLMPNLDFGYPYGILPLFVAYFFSNALSIISSLSITKVLLDVFSIILLYIFLIKFRLIKKQYHVYYLSIFLLLLPSFFNQSISLSSPPIRFLILLLPVIFVNAYISTKKYYYFILIFLTPFFTFLFSTESVLVNLFLLAVILFFFIVLKIEKIKYHLFLLIPIIGFIYFPIIYLFRRFLAKSFEFIFLISEGVVKFSLPNPISSIVRAYYNNSHYSEILFNIFYYVFLFLISLMLYSLFVNRIKCRSNKNQFLAVILLFIIALLSLGKSILAITTLGTQLISAIFIVLAFMVFYENNDILINKLSSKLLLLYCAVVCFNLIFFTSVDLYRIRSYVQTGRLIPYKIVASDAEYTYLLNKNQIQHLSDLIEWWKTIKKDSKLLIISDNSAGLYRILHKVDSTPFSVPIPMYAYSQERINDLVEMINHNNYDYIVWSLFPDDYAETSQLSYLQNSLESKILNKFKKEITIYKTYNFFSKKNN